MKTEMLIPSEQGEPCRFGSQRLKLAALFPVLAILSACTVRTVVVDSSPQGARVCVDGVDRGTTPFETKLMWRRDDDVHRINLRAPDHEPVEWIITRQMASAASEPWNWGTVMLSPLVYTASLHIESTPAGASVRLAGQDLGATPCDVAVKFTRVTSRTPWSTATIEVTAQDYETARHTITYEDVVSRGNNKVSLVLDSLREQVTVPIDSEPRGARILVDGQVAGTTPQDVVLNFRRPTSHDPWNKVRITLELDDHQTTSATLGLEEARGGTRTFELARVRKAVKVTISGANADNAAVLVDNKQVGTVPCSYDFVFTRRSGNDQWTTFHVVVRKEGYRWRREEGTPPGDTSPFSMRLTLEAAESGQIDVHLEPVRYVWTRLREWTFGGKEPGISEARVLSQTVDIETEPLVRSVKRITNMKPGEFLPTRLSVTPPPSQDLVFAESFRMPGTSTPWSNLRRRVGEEALQRVTDGPAIDIEPAVSPDGRYVYFASNRLRPDRLTLWRVSMGLQAGFTKITDSPSSARDTEPAVSPDGRIAFTSYLLGSETPQIWVAAADGSGATQIRVGKQPAWSPDGTLLAFVAPDSAGYDQVWVMPPDGREPVQLTHGNHSRAYPSWTPDKRIVYVSDQVVNEEGLPNKDIWMMNLDGSGQTRLTSNGSYDSHPVVTPDGRYVYFISNRGARAENEDNWQIWRIELPGGVVAP